jgi:methylmalonyl-CoA mutase C-terminal domain/subunit
MSGKVRVLVGKAGLDGHDRGAKVVAAALRDAGMEVVYTGLHQTCESIVDAAVQEDVNVVGISILSGAHMTIFPRILKLLKASKASDMIVIGGGIIPVDDMKRLEKAGVRKLFGPGTPTSEIVDWIMENTAKQKKKKSPAGKKKTARRRVARKKKR